MKIYVIIIAALLLKPLSAQDMYTLETCETDIATDVPQFFQDYFQCVKARLSSSGNYVNLYYSSLPPYESWYYDVEGATSSSNPNWIPFESFAAGSYQNPNVISELDIVISIPVNPTPRTGVTIDTEAVDGEVGTSDYEYTMSYIGCALNGATMYNPCAAPGDVIEDEALSFDLYSGHPGGGAYHYHTTSPGPLEVLKYKMPDVVTNTTPGSAELEIFGINCDGVVVMGCTELDGSAVDPSEWDAQNGHVEDMVGADGTVYFENRYHTHICYTDISDDDADNNGYPDHEFTPEISYYETPGYAGLDNNTSFDRCLALSEPVEPDNGWVALDDDVLIPGDFALYNNYPNPFNPSTTVRFSVLDTKQPLSLHIYDIDGRLIETLFSGYVMLGFHEIQWNARQHPSGVYFAVLQSGHIMQSTKLILIK